MAKPTELDELVRSGAAEVRRLVSRAGCCADTDDLSQCVWEVVIRRWSCIEGRCREEQMRFVRRVAMLVRLRSVRDSCRARAATGRLETRVLGEQRIVFDDSFDPYEIGDQERALRERWACLRGEDRELLVRPDSSGACIERSIDYVTEREAVVGRPV